MLLTSEQKIALVGLHARLGLTAKRLEVLSAFFNDDFQLALKASQDDLRSAGIDRKGLVRWEHHKDLEIGTLFETLVKLEVKVLIRGYEGYPESLHNIHSAPAILFVRGRVEDSDFPSLSVVGSRKMSEYGRRVQGTLVKDIASQGVTIVSGMAYGADALAHQIALEQGSRTIAVLGCGIDRFYPSSNAALCQRILEEDRGAIISEYLPGTEVRPEYFPIRNRIVAGLSKATLIVEAAEKSGTLITARLANNMGREVFSVPGSIFAPYCKGTNQLIERSEAHPILSSSALLEYLGVQAGKHSDKVLADFSIEDQQVLTSMSYGRAIHIDVLQRRLAMPLSEVSTKLLLLEMGGAVEHLGGQNYVSRIS